MRDGRVAADALDEFVALFQRLKADSQIVGTVIVVEGDRDRRSLRRLGIAGPILAVHRGRTLAGTAHALLGSSTRVIVLTDWDTEGGHLAHRLKKFLEAEGPGLDLEYRRRFARILRGELVHVEGLHGWARRQAERRGASIDALVDPDGVLGSGVRG